MQRLHHHYPLGPAIQLHHFLCLHAQTWPCGALASALAVHGDFGHDGPLAMSLNEVQLSLQQMDLHLSPPHGAVIVWKFEVTAWWGLACNKIRNLKINWKYCVFFWSQGMCCFEHSWDIGTLYSEHTVISRVTVKLNSLLWIHRNYVHWQPSISANPQPSHFTHTQKKKCYKSNDGETNEVSTKN